MFATFSKHLVKYDNRFGMVEYLDESLWLCDNERHGEVWRFKFPNGYTVSVARTACWNPRYILENIGCTGGFAGGYYETLVYPTEKGMDYCFDQECWLDHEGVQRELERVKALEEFDGTAEDNYEGGDF